MRQACCARCLESLLQLEVQTERTKFKVSVIIPVLNEETRLPTLLSSLESQSCSTFEVIIIDGGSTDRSLRIIDEYKRRAILDVSVITDTTRNIGYIRNVGTFYADGTILFHTNSDAYIPKNLIQDIRRAFYRDKSLVCLTGRTHPLESSVFSHFAYGAFDVLRWLFIKLKYPARKISPSGNFMAIKHSVFKAIGGFPELRVNEDGELGRKLTQYCADTNAHAHFDLSLWTGHYARRFNQGSLKTIRFYLYVLGNFSVTLSKWLKPIELQSAEKFATR